MKLLTSPVRIALSRLRRTAGEPPGHEVYEPTGVRVETVERTVVLGRESLALRILGPNAWDSATLRITVEGAALLRVDHVAEHRVVESPAATPIEELALPPRVRDVLAAEGIETVEDLVTLSPADVTSINNLGAVALIEVKSALAARGLKLRTPLPGRAQRPQ